MCLKISKQTVLLLRGLGLIRVVNVEVCQIRVELWNIPGDREAVRVARDPSHHASLEEPLRLEVFHALGHALCWVGDEEVLSQMS